MMRVDEGESLLQREKKILFPILNEFQVHEMYKLFKLSISCYEILKHIDCFKNLRVLMEFCTK
jgi:hypothetical protein